jgi:hypothetical protein
VCGAPKGPPTGVGLEISDPTGRPFTGDGGAAHPDGTWSLPFYFSGSPGEYTVRARCAVSNGPALFDYPLATFTVTG